MELPVFTFSLVQCCVSGSSHIGIILPDQNPYSISTKFKARVNFFHDVTDTVLSTILKIMILLVGFGRPCAARTLLFELFATPNGALRDPPPSQLCCFSFDPHKYIKSIQLVLPTSKAFFTPLDHMQTAEAMKYEVPWPRPSQLPWSFPQYFGVKIMCRCDHTP